MKTASPRNRDFQPPKSIETEDQHMQGHPTPPNIDPLRAQILTFPHARESGDGETIWGDAHPSHTRPESETHSPFSTRHLPEKIRLLVIDDNIDDRELLRRILDKVKTLQYTILEAQDGPSGLDMMLQHQPHCVILDNSLPGKEGVKLIDQMRHQNPDTALILLTGNGHEQLAAEALAKGAQDYLTKALINGPLLHQIILNAVQRQALQRRVLEQSEALQVFTRALAHDLNEPVRSVASLIQFVLNDPNLSEESHDFLNIALSSSQHMEELIGMVRFFTRLDAEIEQPEATHIDAEELITQALNNLERMRSDIPHRIELEPDLGRVHINQAQGVVLFQNLIGNALSFGDKNETLVRVSASEEEDMIHFTIQDNGPGISQDAIGNIFQPFKRFANGHHHGSGLGLSICERVIRQNGGVIRVESIPDQGTTFHFTLPKSVSATSEQEPPNEEHASTERVPHLANVLHVDDNPNDLLLTRKMLSKLDQLEMNVQTFANGKEALLHLEKSNDKPVDLILLDINMPVMDGFEFLSHIRADARFEDIPVIICSTSNDAQDKARASDLGADGYVEKPVRLSKLAPNLKNIEGLRLLPQPQGFRLEGLSTA